MKQDNKETRQTEKKEETERLTPTWIDQKFSSNNNEYSAAKTQLTPVHTLHYRHI